MASKNQRMVAQLAARSCGDLVVTGSNPIIRWETFGLNPQTRSSSVSGYLGSCPINRTPIKNKPLAVQGVEADYFKSRNEPPFNVRPSKKEQTVTESSATRRHAYVTEGGPS